MPHRQFQLIRPDEGSPSTEPPTPALVGLVSDNSPRDRMHEWRYLVPSDDTIGRTTPAIRLEVLAPYVERWAEETILDCVDFVMALQRGEPAELPASLADLVALYQQRAPRAVASRSGLSVL